MSTERMTGIYGKLPLHGDFVYRNLPPSLIEVWDEWLQGFVAGSREQLGDSWLDIYLTSPIWRFSLSEGVLDSNAWLGVMLPSVDRVGRYFPISILTKVPGNANLFEYSELQKSWYEGVEELLFHALDGELDIDELLEEILKVPMADSTAYKKVSRLPIQSSTVVKLEFEEQSANLTLPYLLDSFLTSSLRSYSTWTTLGSERVEPCVCITQNLPKIGGIAAMIDGEWNQWSWPQPYELEALHQ